MRVVVGTKVQELGISEDDVLCMLKAVGSRPIEEYVLDDIEQARLLVQRAKEAELERKRTVARWESILAMFK